MVSGGISVAASGSVDVDMGVSVADGGGVFVNVGDGVDVYVIVG
jgi:hypothetical protein